MRDPESAAAKARVSDDRHYYRCLGWMEQLELDCPVPCCPDHVLSCPVTSLPIAYMFHRHKLLTALDCTGLRCGSAARPRTSCECYPTLDTTAMVLTEHSACSTHAGEFLVGVGRCGLHGEYAVLLPSQLVFPPMYGGSKTERRDLLCLGMYI